MSRFRRRLLPPIVVILLALVACAVISELVARADSRRREQLLTTSLKVAVSDLQAAPFNAHAGGPPVLVQRQIQSDQSTVLRGLSGAEQPGTSSHLLGSGRAQFADIEQTVTTVYRLFSTLNGPSLDQQKKVPMLQGRLALQSNAFLGLLTRVGRTDARAASNARLEAQLGSVVALLLLLIVFLFYFRLLKARTHVGRLARQNESLLKVSREEATTDALTGLGNRRALDLQLSRSVVEAADDLA